MPEKKILVTEKAPAAIGPYSQAVYAGNLLFASGQIPLDPLTGRIVGQTVEEQATQCLLNVSALLAAVGLDLENVVKTTVFLTDMADFATFNAVYDSFFSAPYPARSCVAVSALPKGAKVEVEVIAQLPKTHPAC